MPRLGCIKILGEIIYEISKNASNNSIEKFPTKKMLSMNSFFPKNVLLYEGGINLIQNLLSLKNSLTKRKLNTFQTKGERNLQKLMGYFEKEV
jgi:hypothetical protein